MRNLKKILALVLALMMVLSVMVTASAANYADADAIEHTEAVEVMSAIGILQGDGTNFNPDGTLNRAEAAVIIAKMMEGDLSSIDTMVDAVANPFSDVPAWAQPYVLYAYSNGVVIGTSATKYSPKNELTGYQFGKMVLIAAGLCQSADFTADGWQLTVATELKANGLLAGLTDVVLSKPLSREHAAQMAFNALFKSPAGKTVYPIVDGDGNEVAHFDTKNEAMLYLAILDNASYKLGTEYTDSTGALAETVFGLGYVYDTDDFGHTTKVWTATELKNCSVTLEVGAPAATYTAATRASVIAKELKGYTLGGIKVEANTKFTGGVTVPVYINGQSYGSFASSVANGKTPAELLASQTGNGNVLEVYVNGATKAVSKVVITTYKAATLDVATSKATGDVTYTVAKGVSGTVYGDGETPATVVLNGKFADNDIVTYVVAGGNLYLYPTTQITGTITAKTSAGIMTIGNAQYANGAYNTASYAVNPYSVDNYYLDQYGYIAYSNAVQMAASTDYLYAVEWDVKVTNSFNSYAPSVQVRAVLADGTVGVYTLDLDNSGGKWYCGKIELGSINKDNYVGWTPSNLNDMVYGYVINEDGTLVLEKLGTTVAANTVYTETADSINSGVTTVKSSLLTGTTIYVVYNNNTKTAKVYTGSAALKNAYSALGTSYVIGTGLNGTVGNASVVFATSGTAVGTQVANYALVSHTSYVQTMNAKGQNVYTYTGILTDGTTVSLTTIGDMLTETGMYLYNTNGTIADSNKETDGIQAIDLANNDYGLAAGSAQVVGSLLKIGNNYYNYADATVIELGYESLNADDAVYVIYEMARVGGRYSTTDIASILVLE